MSCQDWKTSWKVKYQDNTDLAINTNLSFNELGSKWSINTTQSCSWNGVSCTYDSTSDTMSGCKDGIWFTIERSTVDGKDFIHCDIPLGGAFASAETASVESIHLSSQRLGLRAPASYPKKQKDSSGPTGGGTWTAEEVSG